MMSIAIEQSLGLVPASFVSSIARGHPHPQTTPKGSKAMQNRTWVHSPQSNSHVPPEKSVDEDTVSVPAGAN